MTAEAFSTLYVTSRPRMLSLARRMGIPDMDCEDVVQNAFMGLYKGVKRNNYEHIYTGLVALAVIRGSMDWKRSNHARLCQTIYSEDIDKHDEDGREELLDHVELVLSVRGLTMRQRAVFLALLDGESYREIGARLGVSRERVRQIRADMLSRIRTSCLLGGGHSLS